MLHAFSLVVNKQLSVLPLIQFERVQKFHLKNVRKSKVDWQKLLSKVTQSREVGFVSQIWVTRFYSRAT